MGRGRRGGSLNQIPLVVAGDKVNHLCAENFVLLIFSGPVLNFKSIFNV
jgi:hypothetical protein